ncbi:hypothetical protein JCM5296_005758 [Sporobolomyces johnsonii]
MYNPGASTSAYATPPNGFQRPSSAVPPNAAYPSQAYASGAFASAPPQQQQGGSMDPAALFGQQEGAGAGQQQQWAGQAGQAGAPGGGGQAFASAGVFANNGMVGQQSYSPAPPPLASTTSLFQQQLAQQAAMGGQAQPAPRPAAQPANSYQASTQAYMQSQQQLAQARQAQQNPSQPSPYPSAYPQQSPALPSSQPPSAQQYAAPQQQQQQPQQQQQQRPNPTQPMSNQELSSALRGIDLSQGMTPQRYASLTPHQQLAVREFMIRSRSQQQQQQAQLGLGMPSSPAANALKLQQQQQQQANGSPAPSATGQYGRPGAQQPGGQAAPAQQQPSAPAQAQFLKTLTDFNAKKGIQFNGPPVIEGRSLDLARFYAAVLQAGGFNNVNANRRWGSVATALGFPAASPDQHPDQRLQALAGAYHQCLYAFEQTWVQMQQLRSAQNAQAQAATAAAAQGGMRPSPAPMSATANGAASSPFASAGTPAAPSAPSPHPSPGQLPLLDRNASRSSTYTPQNASTPIASGLPARPPSAAASSSSFVPPQPQTLDLNGAGGSPAPFAARPTTATSQREGTAPFAGADDRKGKGKAIDELVGVVKAEESISGASPAASTPRQPATALPSLDTTANNSPRPTTAEPAKPARPEPPAAPPRRKRQKIEYVPFNKTHDTFAGYDLALVEEVMHQATKRKRPRTAYDLGLVDIHSLTMSLRSRLASEVAFALNSLTLISVSIKTHPQERDAIPFPLQKCETLYEELLDLLEETAFGLDELDNEAEHDDRPSGDEDDAKPPDSYRELFRIVTHEAGELLQPSPTERKEIAALADDGLAPIRPIDTILSLTNLFRNFSVADDNASLMGQDRRLLDVLVRVASLPLKQEQSKQRGRWPVRVTPADSMTLKKDVLETVLNFGLDVRLDEQSTGTATKLFELLLFFLLDSHHQDQLYFDLSTAPSLASRLPQPSSIRIPHYVDLGLAAFARVTLLDANRSIVSRLASHGTLERLFDSLIRLLPVSEADFQIMTHEVGLVYVENLAMSLYNLAFLAPAELKLKLRAQPGYIRSLMRIIRRLAGTAPDSASTAAFHQLTDRCIATLQLLNSLGGVTALSSGVEASDVPWWGMSMSGHDFDDDASGGDDGGGASSGRAVSAQPTEADRATVKQRLPPSASTAAGLDPGPPVLAGETRTLWDLLYGGSMVTVFGALIAMADATGRKRDS